MSTKQEKIQDLNRVEPAVGQIFKTQGVSERFYQILYVDEEVVLLRCEDSGQNGNNTHRIERRAIFNRQIDSGKFEYKPDSNLDMLSFDERDWSEVPYIGEKTTENLHDAGYKTNLDIQQAEEDDLLDVGGLGEKGLAHLLEFAR